MKRRFFSFISVLLILCSILSVSASAAMEPPEDPIDPDDPYVDISAFSASIYINSSGKATSYSTAITATTTYTVYLNMSLQRYKNGTWTSLKSWSTSGTHSASLNKSYYVTSGYYYRTAAAVTVRTSGGSYVESATVYSPSEYY